MKTPPVLLLIFNRPDTTERVFECIRDARPEQLFVAADGPRANREGEAEICSQTRKIIEKVDWKCELKTLFQKENIGCCAGPEQGISWFFDNVDEGIILEDDCLPDPSFFHFCSELLERFREDQLIYHISGNNYFQGREFTKFSYHFSYYHDNWGWATWSRAWKRYQHDLGDWIETEGKKLFPNEIPKSEQFFWSKKFSDAHHARVDAWDYRWRASMWKNKGLSIYPTKNLVENIGFDERATHTTRPRKLHEQRTSMPAIIHPPKYLRSWYADRIDFIGRRMLLQPTMVVYVKWRWNSFLKNIKRFIRKRILTSSAK